MRGSSLDIVFNYILHYGVRRHQISVCPHFSLYFVFSCIQMLESALTLMHLLLVIDKYVLKLKEVDRREWFILYTIEF